MVVLIIALVLLKDALAKSWAQHRIRAETGMETKIGKVELGLFSPTLTIENLKIYNPAEFGGAPWVDVPEMHLEWETAALARQRLHFKLVRLTLNEINIVEGRDGRTNVTGVLGELERLISTNTAAKSVSWKFAGIDTLNLTAGKLLYSSLKHSRQSEVKLGLKNEIISDVRSWSDLSGRLVTLLLNRGITFSSGRTDASDLTRHLIKPRVSSEATPRKANSP